MRFKYFFNECCKPGVKDPPLVGSCWSSETPNSPKGLNDNTIMGTFWDIILTGLIHQIPYFCEFSCSDNCSFDSGQAKVLSLLSNC